MKILRLSVLLLVFPGCATYVKNSAIDPSFQRPQTIRIAALPAFDVNGREFDITYALASEFLKGGWKVVDRSVIEGILKEQRFQVSGAVDKNAVEIGKLSGANFVATGTYAEYPPYLYVRIIEVETGEIVATTACFGQSGLGPCAAKELVRLVNTRSNLNAARR